MHSLSWQRHSFYIVLAGIFALHGALLITQIKDKMTSAWTPPKAIKLTLVQDALKELNASKKRQIVQSEDSPTKAKPLDQSFLSDKPRSFERQTVAKNVDLFKKAGVGNASATRMAKQQKPSRQKKAVMKDLKLSDVGFVAGDPLPKEVSRSPASQSIKGLENGDPISQGFSSTNDYVEEVALGDFTRLNSVEYKFYGFFHRIRQKLEQFWGKSIREKSEAIFKSGRRLPASDNLITSLQVVLNEKGEIINVKILGASGVKELDDAAIESFNQAGPFPNPPRDLLVNGRATIEWGFVVKS